MKSNIFYVYLSVVVIFFLQNLSALHLSIIQVAESSNDLLLIQLICLQLHTPHGLHGAVVLQTLLTGHDHLSGRGLVQLVGVTFLGRKNIPTITHTVHDIHTYIHTSAWQKLTFISNEACAVKSVYVRADMTAATPCHGRGGGLKTQLNCIYLYSIFHAEMQPKVLHRAE